MPFLDSQHARQPQAPTGTCPTAPQLSCPHVPFGLGPGACWSLKAHRPRHKRHRVFDQDVVVLKASLHRAAAASYGGASDDFQQQGFQQQGPRAELDSSNYAQASGGDAPSARQGSGRQQGASNSSSGGGSGGGSSSTPGSYRPDPYGPAAGTVVSTQKKANYIGSWSVWLFVFKEGSRAL